MSTSKDTPLRVGVVGLGLMGRRMLGSFAAHEGFVALAGFDLDGHTRQSVAAEFGFAEADSLDALLRRTDLDFIYVATPPTSHLTLAKAVFDSERPLWLEKPLAVDLQRAEELVDLAEKSAQPSALNFPFATLPGLNRFERELTDGTAGKILRAEVTLHFSQWPRTWHKAGPWLAGDIEGGFLREVFSHFAYLSQRLLAPLEVKYSSVTRSAGSGETRVVADLLAGEVPLSLTGGAGGSAPDFNRWTLYCENRSYRVEDWAKVSTSDGGPWEVLELEPGESEGAPSQLDELAQLLRGNPNRLPSLRDGLNVMRCVEGLLER
ncbi:MAG: 1,5-anhydro-D-fructose reductase (1,5-anhydro-D-mannitol-forming) [Planctomycetota bacterium]|jgi:1,5-anhydro-D-fructose reductase (1,5-anhydro-D-mannitol-forming)